jgi:hypothetical protein
MRSVFAIALLIALSACASQPETTQCPDPRPQVCTMEYAPACALLTSGANKEYASPCNACADDAVVGYLTGPCPE